jgi:chromosome segregation ATPase
MTNKKKGPTDEEKKKARENLIKQEKGNLNKRLKSAKNGKKYAMKKIAELKKELENVSIEYESWNYINEAYKNTIKQVKEKITKLQNGETDIDIPSLKPKPKAKKKNVKK